VAEEKVVRIQPLSAAELALVPPTPENPPEDQIAARKRRIASERAFLEGELEHAKQRIAALNVKPSSVWKKELLPIGGYESTHCLCGATLTILVEGEEPIRTRTINGKIVVTKLATRMCTHEYCTVTLEMADGGQHETPLCRKCARAAIGGALSLETIYARDLAQWIEEPDGKTLAARHARRVPLFVRSTNILEE
jgi:hypothetical protein